MLYKVCMSSSMNKIVHTYSEADTIAYARAFASCLRGGDSVLLHGDLGMGKSVFSRAVIRALSGDDFLEVPSPTFTLVQTYDVPVGCVWHFDLYRLSDPDEVYELGWEEAITDGILLIEWPERLGGLTPRKHYEVILTHEKSDAVDVRKIEVRYNE